MEGGELRKRWLAFLHKDVLGCEEVEGSLVCGGSGCSQVSEALLIEKRIFPEPTDPAAMAELERMVKVQGSTHLLSQALVFSRTGPCGGFQAESRMCTVTSLILSCQPVPK